jgi:hypothetical protein
MAQPLTISAGAPTPAVAQSYCEFKDDGKAAVETFDAVSADNLPLAQTEAETEKSRSAW